MKFLDKNEIIHISHSLHRYKTNFIVTRILNVSLATILMHIFIMSSQKASA